MPLTNDSAFGAGRLSAKTKAIREHLASDPRPFAWCDDYLDRRSLPAPPRPLQLPHLLVSPRTRSGLTPEHIEQLLEFADHQTRQCRPVTRPVRSPSSTRQAPTQRAHVIAACLRRSVTPDRCEFSRGQRLVDVLLHPRAPPPEVNQHSHPARLCARASARYVTGVTVPLIPAGRASRC
jgi:hypothetical protein